MFIWIIGSLFTLVVFAIALGILGLVFLEMYTKFNRNWVRRDIHLESLRKCEQRVRRELGA